MDKIIDILKENGPQEGKNLIKKSGADSFKAWSFCNRHIDICIKIIGRRFLRLDKRVEGYARLSPSILREFLTYTVVGLSSDRKGIGLKAEGLRKRIDKISRSKLDLAKNIVSRISGFPDENTVFIIAGDVVYNMAHDEPRPEISTGHLVRGSDLDIIIVVKDAVGRHIERLDRDMYTHKYRLIKNPAYREEIDYIVKDLKKVKEQLEFRGFASMVASKILEEGQYLWGSREMFRKIKEMVWAKGVPEKLKSLEKKAALERKNAKRYLLSAKSPATEAEHSRLFFTKEELDEIF